MDAVESESQEEGNSGSQNQFRDDVPEDGVEIGSQRSLSSRLGGDSSETDSEEEDGEEDEEGGEETLAEDSDLNSPIGSIRSVLRIGGEEDPSNTQFNDSESSSIQDTSNQIQQSTDQGEKFIDENVVNYQPAQPNSQKKEPEETNNWQLDEPHENTESPKLGENGPTPVEVERESMSLKSEEHISSEIQVCDYDQAGLEDEI